MKKQWYLPTPAFSKYICYPEFLGHYSHFPQHTERRNEGLLGSYNLHLVFGGEGYVFHEGERIPMSKGRGFLYSKGAFQQYGSDPGDPWDVRWIHFGTEIVLPLLDEVDQSRAYLFSFDMEAKLDELFDEMFLLNASYETRSEPRLSALLYELLVKLLQNSEPLHGSVPHEVRQSIRSAADIIHVECASPWSLESMARLTGYSSYHFLRLFQAVMGKTPNRYLTDCRLARAKLLLVSTNLSIAHVALQSGFAQSSYFIKVFRKFEGMSPVKYRQAFG